MKKLSFILINLMLLFSFLAIPLGVSAASLPSKLVIGEALKTPIMADNSAVGTACQALGNADCTKVHQGGVGVNKLIATVIKILSIVVGVASVIMIIIGGLRYVTSNGDSNNVTGAKNTILYALVGLVIAAVAQLIVQFVLNNITH